MQSLEELFTINGIFNDFNKDGLADSMKGCIILDENSSISAKKVAANLAARIGFETTGLNLPVVKVTAISKLPGVNIYIKLENSDDEWADNIVTIELVSDETESSVLIKSSSEKALEYGGSYLYARFPYVWQVKAGALKFDEVKASILKKLPVKKAELIKLVIDNRYEGIYSCKFLLVAENIDYAMDCIKQNLKEFMWNFVGETELLLSDGVKERSVVIKGHELNNSRDFECCRIESDFNTSKSYVDICNLYEIGGLLEDTDGDFIPNSISCKIVIPDDADDYEVIAASNVAARLGIETVGITLPLVCCEKEFKKGCKTSIFIGRTAERYINGSDSEGKDDYTSQIKVLHDGGSDVVLICGEKQDLLDASICFSEVLPYLDKNKDLTINDLKQTINEVLSGTTLDGQITALAAELKSIEGKVAGKEVKCYFEKNDSDLDSKSYFDVRAYFKHKFNLKNIEFNSYKDEQIVWQKYYDIPWEVDEFKEILEQKVYPRIGEGDRVVIEGLLSEEKEVRNKLEDEIHQRLEEKGAHLEKIDIYCSYKQGLSWIMEKIVPKIKEMNVQDKIGEILIRFKRFLREGKDDWGSIEGALPSYDSYNGDDEKWFDLPIRWLQEIYPVDDLLAKELNIDREKIRFEAFEDDDATYEIIVKNFEGEIIIEDIYKVKYSERPYLDEYPKIGKVHPSTGWITVRVNGKVIVDENIKTDLEHIWDIYQREILNRCKNYVLERTNGQPAVEKQPFFKELKMEIYASEPDYDLNIREDRISALDALHEDMYFVALDFFKTFGERSIGKALSEPGLILPYIEKRNGQPSSIKVSLSSEKYPGPRFYIEDDLYQIKKLDSYSIRVDRIGIKNGEIQELEVDVFAEDNFERISLLLETFCELYNSGLRTRTLKAAARSLNKIKINLYDTSRRTLLYEINVKGGDDKGCYEYPKLSESRLNIPQDKVIGYEDYIEIINQLKNIPEVNTWEVSRSYQGRSIYAVDITSEFNVSLCSRTKLINYKPTYMIVNRHHANEVSSTNSSFMLIQKFITDERYREYLKKINLTIIPMENPDGSYIHYQLQKQNPKWKLHVARYNSVGKEIANDYWKETKYGESEAVPRVWRKWLPDVLVDNHGVPSHEWDQQFSGYVAPWFRGFWLPRGIFYGYFYYLDKPGFEYQKEVFEQMQRKVAERLNEDGEVVKWQLDWKDRFEKYASSWMPKMFPADYYKNYIFYWVACKPEQSSRHAAHRYPNVTTVDWITEVSDETAQGDYLKFCSKVHHMADMAIIDLISNAIIEIKDLSSEKHGEVTLKRVRKRPLSF